ncbi:MAG: sensor histidine kinase [Lysobacter sp.]
MATRSGLKRRILLGLLAYAALLSGAVLVHGFVVNEYAERLVWQSLLQAELDHFVERSKVDTAYQWADTETLTLFDGRVQQRLPAALRGLAPGVHDDIEIDGREHVVKVRMVEGRPLLLALDITSLEQREDDMEITVLGSAALLIALLGVVIAWGVGRLVQPLSDMALRIGTLRPDLAGQRIDVSDSASAELAVIADALNDYLQRNERFVQRERTFIDTASHELRTPIAVIAGAAELALGAHELPASARNQLSRIQRTARDVEQLITLLLILAKDPARLAGVSEHVALDQLLPAIVEDHRHLTRDKDLTLVLAPMPACAITAPLPIVQAAIGNLLRNAIENSDRGMITNRLQSNATVTIEDPGHGMTPEEISAIYARMARGDGGRDGGGIGLDLISRLCEHLGWELVIASDVDRGTRTTLDLAPRAG